MSAAEQVAGSGRQLNTDDLPKRARSAINERISVFVVGDRQFCVIGENQTDDHKPDHYKVDYQAGTCTCGDTASTCKHQWRVLFATHRRSLGLDLEGDPVVHKGGKNGGVL
jgi:hypothetical protein